jgi:hypothetical protein
MFLLAALFATAVFGPSAAQAQAQAQVTEKTMTLDGFKEFSTLKASGKIELVVTLDATQPQTMTIEYNGNDQNKVKWWDEQGTMQIKFASSAKDNPIMVKLTCQQLANVSLAKGASMTTTTPWVQKMITVDVSSGSKLTVNVETTDIKLSAQGGAAVIIKGICTYASFDGLTRSSIDAVGLIAVSTDIHASGYSECKIYGSERVVVDAVDGAKIFWRGTPEILRLQHSRGANIYPIGE